MNKDLPLYKISIDPSLAKDGEKLGMTQIAYTATPAIMTKGIAFSDETKKMLFADKLKLRLAAPILIPDLVIFREDDELGQFNVVFTKDEIELMYTDFMENKGAVAFNLDHTTTEAPSFILESWITGPSKTDKSFTEYGIELPEGSVFVISQFKDAEYFQKEIIDKGRTGYSIEGFLGLKLSQIIKNQFKKTETMTKQKFEKQILDDGTPVYVANGEAFIIDDNGDKAPIFDGEHKLKDGSTIVTVGGKVTETKPAEAMATEKPVEEKMADAPVAEAPAKTEEKPETPASTGTPEEAAILAVVQPKLDELMKVIADLKTQVESDSVEDIAETEMAKSKFSVQKKSEYSSLTNLFKSMK